jgi:hypothetical protein
MENGQRFILVLHGAKTAAQPDADPRHPDARFSQDGRGQAFVLIGPRRRSRKQLLKRPAPGGGRRGGHAGLEEFPAMKIFIAHDYPHSKKIAFVPFLLFYL